MISHRHLFFRNESFLNRNVKENFNRNKIFSYWFHIQYSVIDSKSNIQLLIPYSIFGHPNKYSNIRWHLKCSILECSKYLTTISHLPLWDTIDQISKNICPHVQCFHHHQQPQLHYFQPISNPMLNTLHFQFLFHVL